MKSTKTNETRTVPLPDSVRTELLKLAGANPYHTSRFIFYSADPDRPVDAGAMYKALVDAYVDSKLKPAERTDPAKRTEKEAEMHARKITFHSWRHLYAATLADRVSLRTVQMGTGHKNAAMAEHYASHTDGKHFAELAEAVGAAFGNIIPFTKEATS